MRRIDFSPAEIAWLRENANLSLGAYHAQFQAVFERPEISIYYLNQLRAAREWMTRPPLGGSRLANIDPADREGRINAQGYRIMKVGGRTVTKHAYLWKRKNGPVPAGMVLRCIDGNKLNTDPSNWEPEAKSVVLSAVMILRRGRIPADFRETAFAIAKVREKVKVINQRRAERTL